LKEAEKQKSVILLKPEPTRDRGLREAKVRLQNNFCLILISWASVEIFPGGGQSGHFAYHFR